MARVGATALAMVLLAVAVHGISDIQYKTTSTLAKARGRKNVERMKGTMARQKVVYGKDDRRDMYQVDGSHPDPEYPAPENADILAQLGKQSVAALWRASRVESHFDGNGRFTGFDDQTWTDLQSSRNLCPGQRFGAQPTVAYCSGTLVANNAIITAGHCITSSSDCENTRFVFNYYVDSVDGAGVPTMHTITRDDVYSCKSVSTVLTSSPQDLDWAYVVLDRIVVGHSPVDFQATAGNGYLNMGDGLVVIGFGSGLPMKIDAGGNVSNARGDQLDYFTGFLDTFGGNSGSGVFTVDSNGAKMVGILVRGATDYVTRGGCNVVNVISDSTWPAGGEECTYVHHAADAHFSNVGASTFCMDNNNGGCSHICSEPGEPSVDYHCCMYLTHACSCPSDLYLSEDEKSCVAPVNECEPNGGRGPCAVGQVCTDTNSTAGYTCSCPANFVMSTDGMCVACRTGFVSLNTPLDWSSEMAWVIETTNGQATGCSSRPLSDLDTCDTFTESCCLPEGDYTLRCIDSYEDGWAWFGTTGSVMIGGVSYCNTMSTVWGEREESFTWTGSHSSANVVPAQGGCSTCSPECQRCMLLELSVKSVSNPKDSMGEVALLELGFGPPQDDCDATTVAGCRAIPACHAYEEITEEV